MKKLIALTAVSLAALTGAASAMTNVSDANVATIAFYAPNADVDSLTSSEVNVALSVIHSGDSEGEKRAAIQALLR